MKKLKYIIVLLALLSMVSCNDFFDTRSPSVLNNFDAFKYSDQAEQAVFSIYEIMGEDKSYRNRLIGGYVHANTDIEMVTLDKKPDYANYAVTATNSDLGNSAKGADPWGWLYKGVERANLCVYGIETKGDTAKTASDQKFRHLLGEALTLRAFYYSELIKWWGDVPAIFDPIAIYPDKLYTPKTDRNVIYERILSDLKRAEDLVPYAGQEGWYNTVERVNKAFVKGLRARIALRYAGKALRPVALQQGVNNAGVIAYNLPNAGDREKWYQEALNETADIIKQYGTSKLEANYIDIFKKQCQGQVSFSNTESLFEIPFSGQRGEVVNLLGPKVQDSAGDILPNFPKGHSSNGMQVVVPSFIFDFDPSDARLGVTVCPVSWRNDTVDKSIYTTDEDLRAKYAKTPILWQRAMKAYQCYIGKWRFEWMNQSPAGESEDGVNYCIMRYADILLMYAEASLGGRDGDAIPTDLATPQATSGLSFDAAFNKVRERAGLTTPKTLTFDAMVDERAFEFCGEGLRRYDLIRWGMLKEKIDAAVAEVKTNISTIDNIYVYCKYQKNAFNGYEITNVNYRKAVDKSFSKGVNNWSELKLSTDISKTTLLKNFTLYALDPDLHQLWPIFQTNTSASNGSLWNDYGY